MKANKPEAMLASIPETAAMLGVTDRRLRQHCEAGGIPRPERGMVDPGWALYFASGQRMTAELSNPPKDPGVLVAVAWAIGCGGPAGAREDRALLVELFERNGKTADDALISLGRAVELIEQSNRSR